MNNQALPSGPVQIVGQGLAGSVLAWRLIKAGFDVRVFDEALPGRSSAIAPGLFTPITGKRLAEPWGAPEVHDVARAFYREVEAETGSSFYHPMEAWRVFDTEEERSAWEERRHRETYARWVADTFDVIAELPHNYGGLSLKHAGWVNLPVFLEAVRNWLKRKGAWREDPPESGCRIFCTGHRWPPPFDFIPLRANKGDVLLVRCQDKLPPRILHRGVYVLPLGGHLAKVGGVFEREFQSPEPSAELRAHILGQLKALVAGEVEVLEQHAGIRPSTTHFKPIAGFLPEDPGLGVFNSLGSKGVLYAPLASLQFVRSLTSDAPMDPQVNLITYVEKYRGRSPLT